MLRRLKDVSDELSLRSMPHILIAMVLAPLFLIKILVARYYKSYTAVLVPLGVTIFTRGFVLIASTAGPCLLRRATIKNISLDAIDIGSGLARIDGAREDARGWLATINRMRALPGWEYRKPTRELFCRNRFPKTQSIVPTPRAYWKSEGALSIRIATAATHWTAPMADAGTNYVDRVPDSAKSGPSGPFRSPPASRRASTRNDQRARWTEYLVRNMRGHVHQNHACRLLFPVERSNNGALATMKPWW